MKNYVSTIMLLASLSCYSQQTQRQHYNPTLSTKLPASPMLKRMMLNGFLSNLHQLSIENKIYQMQQNGQTEAHFSSGILIKSQFSSSYYTNNEENYTDFIQVIPYKLSLTSDGRCFVDVSAAGLGFTADRIALGFDVLSIEYQKDYNYEGNTDLFIKLGQGYASSEFISDDQSNSYLQGNLNAYLGASGFLEHNQIRMGGNTGLGVGIEYGLTYQKSANQNTFHISMNGVNSTNNYKGYWAPGMKELKNEHEEINQLNQNEAINAQAEWDATKLQWEIDHGYGSAISNEHYIGMSGAEPRPANASIINTMNYDYTQKVNRTSFNLTPSIGYSRDFKNGSSIRVDLSAKVFLKDEIQGSRTTVLDNGEKSLYVITNNKFINENLLSNNPNTYSVKLTFTLGSKVKKLPEQQF